MDELIINFLPENIPSKKNSKQIFINRKTGARFITSSKNYKQWEEDNINYVERQLEKIFKDDPIDIEPIQKCNSIELGIRFYTKHRKDLTNVAEGIMDVLVRSGVIDDDCHQVTGEILIKPLLEGNTYAKIYY